jgi:TPR repeat protein
MIGVIKWTLLAGSLAASTQAIAAGFHEGFEAYEQNSCKKAYRIWYVQGARGDDASKAAMGLFKLWGCSGDSDFTPLKNPADGIKILETSKQPELLFELARFFEKSDGVFNDAENAIRVYKKAYNLGSSGAVISLFELTKDKEWREAAVGMGYRPAICEDGLISLDRNADLNPALESIERCEGARRIDAMLKAAGVLLERGQPNKALDFLRKIPKDLAGDLREDVALKIVLKEGAIREGAARDFLKLAKHVDSVREIKKYCQKAVNELGSAEKSYKQLFEQPARSIDKTPLERALQHIAQALKDAKIWCDRKIDSKKFTIEKALTALDDGQYQEASKACEFFSKTGDWEKECNFIRGVILFYGHDRSKDETWGKGLLKSASEAGYTRATLALATISVYEDALDNVEKTKRLLEKLTRTPNSTTKQKGNAWLLLGDLEKRVQDERFTGGKDYYPAKKAYDKSKELDYWPAYAALGVLYHERKTGLMNNPFGRALEMFKIAGDHNVKRSFPWLCMYYATGKGVSANEQTAAKWCQKAVDSGYHESMKYLN